MNIKSYDNEVNWEELDELEIKECSFSENPSPKTTAKVAYSKTNGLQVFVRTYRLPERAVCFNNGEDVWQDSCLECFVSFDNVKYINMEANSNGALLTAIGKDRYERTSLFTLDKALPNVKAEVLDDGWTVLFTMPNQTIKDFFNVEVTENTPVYLNIYCCGDLTPNPYYGALNEPKSEVPDFHLIQFFKEMIIK